MTFVVDDRATRYIRVTSVPCRMYVDRLQRGERVCFIKRTHGIWDHLTLLVTGELRRERYRRCDQMIFKEQRGEDPTADPARRDYFRYLSDLLADVLHPPKDTAPTVALALDYLTRRSLQPTIEMPVATDPRLQAYWETSYSYAEFFARFELWDRPWEFAQMPAVGVVTQQILRLVEAARRYHVVVYGPEKLRDLGRRWSLPAGRFSFFAAPPWPDVRPRGTIFSDPVLPRLSTHASRFDTLQLLSSVRASRPRLFLFEAGTVSQWLIGRLAARYPRDSFLDLGRALELWFPDYPWPLKDPLDAHFRRAARSFYGSSTYAELRSRLRDPS